MSSDANKYVSGVFILEEAVGLSLDELCHACSAEQAQLVALVDEGVVTPSGAEPAGWRFTGVHLRRARVAVRLERDLGVNPAGAALALQLMDELDDLRARLRAIGAAD